MALKPITELINALQGMALPGIVPARIGESAPKLPADLPTLRLVASELSFSPLGIGGSRRVYVDGDDNLVEDRGRRIKGVVNLEIWGADEDAVNVIALAVAERVADAEIDLLGKGFLRFRQSKWLAAEEAPLRGTQSGAQIEKALKQILAYDIVFEDVETVPSGEGVISEIDVRIKPPVEEGFDIK
jgi:hypothetical protein